MYINNSLLKILSDKIAFPTVDVEIKLKHTKENQTLILNTASDQIEIFHNDLKLSREEFQIQYRNLIGYECDDISFQINAKNNAEAFSSTIIGSTRDFFAQSSDEDLLNQICEDNETVNTFYQINSQLLRLPINKMVLQNYDQVDSIGLNILPVQEQIYKGLINDNKNEVEKINFTLTLTIVLSAYSKDELVSLLLNLEEQNLDKSYIKSIKVIVTKSLDIRKQNDDIFYQIVEFTHPNVTFELEYLDKEFSDFLKNDFDTIETDLVMFMKGTRNFQDKNHIPKRLLMHHICGRFISLQLFDSENIYLRKTFEELKGIIFEQGSIMFGVKHLKQKKSLELNI